MPGPKASAEAFDSFVEDLLSERGVRPLLLIGASKVDLLLMQIIESYLLPKLARPKEQDELLGIDFPLGTFSSRIKLCRRLALVDDSLYKSLEKLRTLRNLSAHSVNFDHGQSPVRDHLSDLKGLLSSRESYSLIRHKYFDDEPLTAIEEWQCALLTICALLEIIRSLKIRVRQRAKILKISAK